MTRRYLSKYVMTEMDLLDQSTKEKLAKSMQGRVSCRRCGHTFERQTFSQKYCEYCRDKI